MAVVRLSDLRNGNTQKSEKKSGVVRLSDIRAEKEAETKKNTPPAQVADPYKEINQNVGMPLKNPSMESLMGTMQSAQEAQAQKDAQWKKDHPVLNAGATVGKGALNLLGQGVDAFYDNTGLTNVSGGLKGAVNQFPAFGNEGSHSGLNLPNPVDVLKGAGSGLIHPDQASAEFQRKQDLENRGKPKLLQMANSMGGAIATDPLSYTPAIGSVRKAFDALKAKKAVEIHPPTYDKINLLMNTGNKPTLTTKINANTLKPYIEPTKFKVASAEQTLDKVMTKIKPIVTERMTPPYENPNELAKWVQAHLGTEISLNEVRKVPYEGLRQMAEQIRPTLNVAEQAIKAAKEMGHDLPSLLDGKAPSIADKVSLDASKRVAGIYPESLPTLKKPAIINTKGLSQPKPTGEVIAPKVETAKPVIAPNVVEEAPKVVRLTDLRAQKDNVFKDEVKFAQTVRNSENTNPELAKALEENPVVGARTTDILNRKEAEKLINKHGQEVLPSMLLAKRNHLSSAETTAAEILAKQLSSTGKREDLARAIELVSKTAKGGREMGQALQALSQWNKLDEAGVLLMGQRQLNKNIPNMDEWVDLTPEQGAPLQDVAKRIGTAQSGQDLASEVMNIVTNKKAGEALTDAEKATIQQFQDQVKMVNDKTKGFLPKSANKATETIKEVSQIEPKARTRDQVINFLDAKAEKARQRIAASRNKISSTPLDIYADYSIIGASHIAKGAVKLADFTEKMVRDFGEAIKPKINEIFTKSTNIFRRENGLPTVEQLDRVVKNAITKGNFTKEEGEHLKALAAEIGHMQEGFKKEATQDLQMLMKELGDSTLGEKIATIETGAMLLNSVTFERNLIGNATQFLQDKMSKLGSIPVDLALSVLTKGERTVVFRPMNQESFWHNWWIGTKSGWKGVSPTGMLESYDIHPNVFKKRNPFKYITKSLGASLQGFDYAFYSANKGDILATYGEQLGKAQGLSRLEIKKGMKDLILQLDDRIHELADHAGLYATYQDETMLSKGAEMLKRGLNYPTDLASRKLVDAGMKRKYSMEGYGLGTIVAKFAKTPANLIMRGLDFSPVGFIRAAYELAPLVFNKAKFSQHEASRALGRAITGTLGLTGMGYILADAGILSGSYSLDKDKRSIEEQSGQGSYKVNWSALERFVTSGFDYDAAKVQKGDRMMDYAWIQPMAISVSMGVNANKAVKEMNLGESINGWKAAGSALLGSLATVLENPMVQGVSNVVDATTDLIKNKRIDKFVDIAKSIPARFVPTFLNQARTATDNNQRETFDADLFTEMGNMMANKVPGISKKLPVSYDSLGNAREKIQGGESNTIQQYLTAFFSPARMTKYEVSDEAKVVLDLMNESGDQNVLPRIAARYFHVTQGDEKTKVDLTATQYSELQKFVGELTKEKLQQKAEFLSNPNIKLDVKVKRVKEILSDVAKKAREQVGTKMGYKKREIKG